MRTALVVFLVVGCTMGERADHGEPAPLDAGRWRLVEVDGGAASSEAEGWLEIDLARSRVSGSTGCNSFEADFEGSPEALSMGAVSSTKKMCPGPLMAQERRVYEILSAAREMAVDDDGMLRISGSGGYLRASVEAE